MAQVAAEPGEGEEEPPFSVIEEALRRGQYTPVHRPEGGVCSLGVGEDFDWFVHNILAVAGVKVECVKEETGVPMYTALQIVGRPEKEEALSNRVMDTIQFAEKENMLGLQVKLHGEHTWKVEVVDEALDQHRPDSGRLARRAQSAKVTKIENMHLYEIAVPVPGLGMRCTVAVPRTMTINISFATSLDGEQSVWKDNLPIIFQRRIDGVFVNKFVHCVQVCSMFQNTDGTRNTRLLGTEHTRSEVFCVCVQGLWYDEGLDLSDTRSGALFIKEWKNLCQGEGAMEDAQVDLLREVTSAQVDLTNLGAKHQHWYKHSELWGADPQARSGA